MEHVLFLMIIIALCVLISAPKLVIFMSMHCLVSHAVYCSIQYSSRLLHSVDVSFDKFLEKKNLLAFYSG